MQLHVCAGDAVSTPWSVHLTRKRAGWSWASLRVLTLGAGESHTFSTDDEELLVVPLDPGERAWLITHDPDYAWVRQTWVDQPVDPRLEQATEPASARGAKERWQ